MEWLKEERLEVLGGDLNLHSLRWGSDEDQGRNEREQTDELLEWCTEKRYKILNNGTKTCIDRRTGRRSATDITICSEAMTERCTW